MYIVGISTRLEYLTILAEDNGVHRKLSAIAWTIVKLQSYSYYQVEEPLVSEKERKARK